MIRPRQEIEQSIIGCILFEPKTVMPEMISRLSEKDFIIQQCRDVFEVCKKQFIENKPIDVLIVLDKLGDDYKNWLVDCARTVPTAAHYKTYITSLKNISTRQLAYEKGLELLTEIDNDQEIDECQSLAVELCKLLNTTETDETFTATEGFSNFKTQKTTPKEYLKTGFLKLDRNAYIDSGDYIIIGGRPSSGKTAFTLQMMLALSKTKNVVYFSLETSCAKIFDRLIANYTRTPFDEIKHQNIQNWEKILNRNEDFSSLKFSVVEAAGWTVAQIKAKTIMLKADVIFIDYISLIKSDGKSFYERVSNISIGLRTLAQSSKVTVFALSQLNRDGQYEPDMTSLRESGQLEQDADVILLLHTVDLDKVDANRKLIIAKNKEGRLGAIPLSFVGRYQLFAEQ